MGGPGWAVRPFPQNPLHYGKSPFTPFTNTDPSGMPGTQDQHGFTGPLHNGPTSCRSSGADKCMGQTYGLFCKGRGRGGKHHTSDNAEVWEEISMRLPLQSFSHGRDKLEGQYAIIQMAKTPGLTPFDDLQLSCPL